MLCELGEHYELGFNDNVSCVKLGLLACELYGRLRGTCHTSLLVDSSDLHCLHLISFFFLVQILSGEEGDSCSYSGDCDLRVELCSREAGCVCVRKGTAGRGRDLAGG